MQLVGLVTFFTAGFLGGVAKSQLIGHKGPQILPYAMAMTTLFGTGMHRTEPAHEVAHCVLSNLLSYYLATIITELDGRSDPSPFPAGMPTI